AAATARATPPTAACLNQRPTSPPASTGQPDPRRSDGRPRGAAAAWLFPHDRRIGQVNDHVLASRKPDLAIVDQNRLAEPLGARQPERGGGRAYARRNAAAVPLDPEPHGVPACREPGLEGHP